jgi:hypothetical protein
VWTNIVVHLECFSVHVYGLSYIKIKVLFLHRRTLSLRQSYYRVSYKICFYFILFFKCLGHCMIALIIKCFIHINNVCMFIVINHQFSRNKNPTKIYNVFVCLKRFIYNLKLTLLQHKHKKQHKHELCRVLTHDNVL